MTYTKHQLYLKFAIICLFLVTTINSVQAQQDSISLRRAAGKVITERFPATRLVNLEYQYITPSDYKIKTRHKSLGKTTIEEQSRVKLNINVPLYRLKKWTFVGTFDYDYSHYALNDISSLNKEFGGIKESQLEGQNFRTAINAVYISRLFNKPLIYNMSILGNFSQKGFERITGMGIASILLKRSKKISLTTGLLVLIDPMMKYPVLPILGLEYRMTDDWTLSVALPKYAYIRKNFSQNTRLSLGSYLNGYSYYIHPRNDKSYLYKRAEINSGLIFEQYMNKHFIFTARTGMVNSLTGNLTQRNKSYSKRIITTSQNAGFYFNIGLSYNMY